LAPASGQQKPRPIDGAGFSAPGDSVADSVARELVASFVVMLGMQLGRLGGMVLRVQVMGAGYMRMVGRLLLMPGSVRLGSGVVVPCGVFVLGCGVLVMLDLFLV